MYTFVTALRSQLAPHLGVRTTNLTQLATQVHVSHHSPNPNACSCRRTHHQPSPTNYSCTRLSPPFKSQLAPHVGGRTTNLCNITTHEHVCHRPSKANWLHMSEDALPTFDK